jgi:hypothetical protein
MDREFAYAFRDRLSTGLYSRAFLLLEETFLLRGRELNDVMGLARTIKTALEKISPLIQQITGTVCPRCADVCCISKHGFYNYEDLVYLFALGLRPPSIDLDRNEHDPCQFLSESGCSMERSIRPSGCNWYFCDPLLEVIEQTPDYHEFDDSLRDLAETWMKMLDEFSRISPSRPDRTIRSDFR